MVTFIFTFPRFAVERIVEAEGDEAWPLGPSLTGIGRRGRGLRYPDFLEGAQEISPQRLRKRTQPASNHFHIYRLLPEDPPVSSQSRGRPAMALWMIPSSGAAKRTGYPSTGTARARAIASRS